MVTQLLFGEHFKVVEKRNKWSQIRIAFDNYEGWIDNKQFVFINHDDYNAIDDANGTLAGELIDFATDNKANFLTISIGSSLPYFKNSQLTVAEKQYSYEGEIYNRQRPKKELIETAFKFLNTPYLWGGKSPFGIDCSGFTQLVYRLCGYRLMRDAAEQATQGTVLSFIEESEPGDLAFFDNAEGIITHVGIIMKDNYIIHAHGKVRIDRIDHTGIFNVDSKKHTHKLRVIKKII